MRTAIRATPAPTVNRECVAILLRPAVLIVVIAAYMGLVEGWRLLAEYPLSDALTPNQRSWLSLVTGPTSAGFHRVDVSTVQSVWLALGTAGILLRSLEAQAIALGMAAHLWLWTGLMLAFPGF